MFWEQLWTISWVLGLLINIWFEIIYWDFNIVHSIVLQVRQHAVDCGTMSLVYDGCANAANVHASAATSPKAHLLVCWHSRGQSGFGRIGSVWIIQNLFVRKYHSISFHFDVNFQIMKTVYSVAMLLNEMELK